MNKKNTVKKECYFCVNNVREIDYKDTNTLKKYITFHQKILAGSRTGTCAWHQRKLAMAIKRARTMALLRFTNK